MAGRQDTGGLTTALQLLGASGHVADDAAPQSDLFEAEAPLPLPLTQPAERAAGKPGRPPGARNKSTEEWVRYFLGRYRSPMTALAEIYSRPLGQLVDDLQAMSDKHKGFRPGSDTRDGYWERIQVNPLEVLKMQRDAAAALLPYIHKKQPVAVEIDGRRPGVVVVGDLNVTSMLADGDVALPLPDSEENQGLIDVTPTQSDGIKSESERDQ